MFTRKTPVSSLVAEHRSRSRARNRKQNFKNSTFDLRRGRGVGVGLLVKRKLQRQATADSTSSLDPDWADSSLQLCHTRRHNGHQSHVPARAPVHRDASPRHGGRPDDQPSGATGAAVAVSEQGAGLLVRRAGLLYTTESPRIGHHSTESGMAVNEIVTSISECLI